MVAQIGAISKEGPALRPRGQGRAQLRKLGIRAPRRRRPRVSQAAVCNGGLIHKRFELWLKGILAAAISGGAGGVLTGFAAVGIDPQHFNLQAGIGATLRIAAAAALINAVIGVAAYLQKSPLPHD